ncbi:chloramphenicol resistance protein, partial [Hominenteromicrobium sp.]
MSISVLAGIREYLSGCPLFDNGLIRVNYLEGEPIAYTVDEVPAKPVVRQYTDGSSLRQAEFVIASSEYYSRDEIENLKVSGFYEQLADWLEMQSESGVLPELPRGCTAQKIEVLTNGY